MLGSETKIKDILKGLNQSLLRNINYRFQLYGHEKVIKKNIEKYKRLLLSSEIIDCVSYISMDDKPSEILKAKENSSIVFWQYGSFNVFVITKYKNTKTYKKTCNSIDMAQFKW